MCNRIRILSRIFEQEGWGFYQVNFLRSLPPYQTNGRQYHGKMSHTARDRVIEDFEQDEAAMILLASLKSGGIGLNLTMANRVISVDLWWNSSIEQQAFCRVFRIGQKRETHIQRFVVENSVDDNMIEMQDRKTALVERVLGDDGQAREATSVNELMRLFGRVDTDEEGHQFIYAEDEEEPPQEAHGVPYGHMNINDRFYPMDRFRNY